MGHKGLRHFHLIPISLCSAGIYNLIGINSSVSRFPRTGTSSRRIRPPPSPRHRPSASRSTTVLRHRCVYPCGRVSRQSRVDHTDRGERARRTVTGEISIAASAKGCPGVRDCERAESLHRMMSMHRCGSPVITCPLAIWSSAWSCLATARPGRGWPGFMSMMTLS
jgi:hypothetical protein